jgi:hypothetical protein
MAGKNAKIWRETQKNGGKRKSGNINIAKNSFVDIFHFGKQVDIKKGRLVSAKPRKLRQFFQRNIQWNGRPYYLCSETYWFVEIFQKTFHDFSARCHPGASFVFLYLFCT